jgi:hypothetical protein
LPEVIDGLPVSAGKRRAENKHWFNPFIKNISLLGCFIFIYSKS